MGVRREKGRREERHIHEIKNITEGIKQAIDGEKEREKHERN